KGIVIKLSRRTRRATYIKVSTDGKTQGVWSQRIDVTPNSRAIDSLGSRLTIVSPASEASMKGIQGVAIDDESMAKRKGLGTLRVPRLCADENVVGNVCCRNPIVINEVAHKKRLARSHCPVHAANYLTFVTVIEDAIFHNSARISRCWEV